MLYAWYVFHLIFVLNYELISPNAGGAVVMSLHLLLRALLQALLQALLRALLQAHRALQKRLAPAMGGLVDVLINHQLQNLM